MSDDDTVAAILPRGLGLIVVDDDPARRRMAWLLKHSIAMHLACGSPGFGLPEVPARSGLFIYSNDLELARAQRRIRKIAEKTSKQAERVTLSGDLPLALNPMGFEPARDRELLVAWSKPAVITLPSPDIVLGREAHNQIELGWACQQLAAIAEAAETTIFTSIRSNGLIGDYAFGEVWAIPEFAHTQWSAHILPTEEANVSCIHIVARGKTVVRLSQAYTVQP